MDEIEIVVRGTVNGYKNWLTKSANLPKEDQNAIDFDFRGTTTDKSTKGEECYAISFSPNYRVFSIYRIIVDVQRTNSPGFLGISLFIPFKFYLKGEKIKNLLDKLMKEYRKLIINDYLTEKIEDKNIFIRILNSEVLGNKDYLFSHKTQRIVDKVPLTKKKSSGYIIYRDEENLYTYFEDADQRVYYNYLQVLLIEKEKQKSKNILTTLEYSDELTDKVDVLDPWYTILQNWHDDIKIKINNEDVKSEKKFKKGDQVNIEFFSPFCKPTPGINGTIESLSTISPKVIDIDHGFKTITILLPTFVPRKVIVKIEIYEEDQLTASSAENPIVNMGKSNINIFKDFSIKYSCGQLINMDYQLQEGILLLRENIEAGCEIKILPKASGKKRISSKTHSKNFFKIEITKILIPLLTISFIVALLYALFLFFRTSDTPRINTTESSIQSNYFDSINTYTSGMELKHDVLVRYKDIITKQAKLSSDENITQAKEKLDNAIKFREFINDGKVDKIKDIPKNYLSDDQNKFRSRILEYPKYFRTILHREQLNLSEIINRIEQNSNKENARGNEDDIASTTKANKQIANKQIANNNNNNNNNNKEINKENNNNKEYTKNTVDKKSEAQGKTATAEEYSEKEYFDLLKNIKNKSDSKKIVETRLTTDQKVIYNCITEDYTRFKKIIIKYQNDADLKYSQLKLEINANLGKGK